MQRRPTQANTQRTVLHRHATAAHQQASPRATHVQRCCKHAIAQRAQPVCVEQQLLQRSWAATATATATACCCMSAAEASNEHARPCSTTARTRGSTLAAATSKQGQAEASVKLCFNSSAVLSTVHKQRASRQAGQHVSAQAQKCMA